MKLFKSLLVAPATLGLLAPMSATANELNLADVSGYSSSEEVLNISEFDAAKELAVTNSRVDGLEARFNNLEAGSFSETTTASFSVDFLVGSEEGKGISATGETDGDEAVEFDYSFQIDLNTSFTGEDSLDISIDAGNAASDATGDATSPNAEFDPNATSDALTVDGISYTFPLGDELTVFVGTDSDGSALFTTACVYGTPSNTLDDCGVPNAGITGGGVAAGASYDVGNGFSAAFGIQATESGILTDETMDDAYAFNAAYIADNYGVSITYANVEDGTATGNNDDTYTALNGYIAFEGYPTLSAGIEYGNDDGSTDDFDDQTTAYFIGATYPVGAGELGVGYGTHNLNNGMNENTDDEIMLEAYYSYPVNDSMTITPLIYTKEQNATTAKPTLDDLTGVMVKTSFSF